MQLIATDGTNKSPVHFSVMTGKLDGFNAINTNTATNDFCRKMFESGQASIICVNCYSMNMLHGSRKNCQPAFQRNSDLLSERVLEPHEIPRTTQAWVRLHGHGELINETHMQNFIWICAHNPQTTFALWTKRKDLIKTFADRKALPMNLILIYSNPRTDRLIKQPPKHFHKVFNNVTTETKGENCTGQKCITCLKCYTHGGESVIIEREKKRS
jgi:hypothetical protein